MKETERGIFDPLTAAVFTAAAAINLLLALSHGLFTIDDEKHFLLNDDYMIIQRYAYNAVAKGELTYNPGERVEGFSEPLILFALAIPLELLKVEGRNIGLVVWIVQALFSGFIAALLYCSGKGYRKWLGCLAAAIYISLPGHFFFSYAGLSVYWESLGILLAFVFLKKKGWEFWLVTALLPLVHATMLPIWLMLLTLRSYRDKKLNPAGLAAALLPMALYFVFRMAYYGSPFPNTYYMKSSGVWNFAGGFVYLCGFLAWMAPLAVLSALVTAYKNKREPAPEAAFGVRDVVPVFLPYLFFTLKVGGDNFPCYRFYFILLPAVLMILSRLQPRGWMKGAVAVLAMSQICMNIYGHFANRQYAGHLLRTESRRVALGLAIRRNTSENALVAAFGIGQIGYYSRRPMLDMLGKTDPYISRARPKLYRRVSHQKSDPEYAMGREPAYVIMSYDMSSLEDVEKLTRESRGEWGYVAELALYSEFRRHYRQLAGPRGPVGIYCRDDLPCENWSLPEEVYLN